MFCAAARSIGSVKLCEYKRHDSLRVQCSYWGIARTALFWTEITEVVPGICWSHSLSLRVTTPSTQYCLLLQFVNHHNVQLVSHHLFISLDLEVPQALGTSPPPWTLWLPTHTRHRCSCTLFLILVFCFAHMPHLLHCAGLLWRLLCISCSWGPVWCGRPRPLLLKYSGLFLNCYY